MSSSSTPNSGATSSPNTSTNTSASSRVPDGAYANNGGSHPGNSTTHSSETNTQAPRKGTSIRANSLIWFGAALSVAEIQTGTYLAPLGFWKAVEAIVLGHIFGCALLFFAGLIGAYERRSAMQTVGLSFGRIGASIFACINLIQLVGWTSIMVYDSSVAAQGIAPIGAWIWAIVVGVLVLIWVLVGITRLGKLNAVAITALCILAAIISFRIFGAEGVLSAASASGATDASSAGGTGGTETMLSFGAAVELAVAMPLSFLALISDYTREAERPFPATLASVVSYGVTSCWMFIIGLGAAIYTASSTFSEVLLKIGLSTAGLVVIVFSTVVNTYLDAWSSGVSAQVIWSKLSHTWVSIGAVVVGTALAMTFNMDNISPFLIFIGSVFSPLVAIILADYYLLRRRGFAGAFNLTNIIIWVIGRLIYEVFAHLDLPIGNSIPTMLVIFIVCIVVATVQRRMGREPQWNTVQPAREEAASTSKPVRYIGRANL